MVDSRLFYCSLSFFGDLTVGYFTAVWWLTVRFSTALLWLSVRFLLLIFYPRPSSKLYLWWCRRAAAQPWPGRALRDTGGWGVPTRLHHHQVIYLLFLLVCFKISESGMFCNGAQSRCSNSYSSIAQIYRLLPESAVNTDFLKLVHM